jgi:hypothetical protein
MSRPTESRVRITWLVLAVITAWCLGGPRAASAMQAPVPTRATERARIEARIDSLSRLAIDARDRFVEVRRASEEANRSRSASGTDTFRVGPLTVVVLDGRTQHARPYFEKAWTHYRSLLEPRADAAAQEFFDRLNARVFLFQDGLFPRQFEPDRETMWITTRPWVPRRVVEAKVLSAVGVALQTALPLPQLTWVEHEMFSESPDWEASYRRLTVGLSPTLRRCKSGELESCWMAMGETGSEQMIDDLGIWYTEAQRLALGRSSARLSSQRASCEKGELDACDRHLLEVYGSLIPLGDARGSLVSVALEMGGEGALVRFAESATLPPDFRKVLANTAGTDADAVMTEWHHRALAAKPDRPRADQQARVGTLLWMLLFMAFATRSSRCRLG